MPGDVIAHDHAVAAVADLDPVLRDVGDRPVSLDRILPDRNPGIRPVRDDPAFLIEGDDIAGDCPGRARAIAERVIINCNAVLAASKRWLVADIVDVVAGVCVVVVVGVFCGSANGFVSPWEGLAVVAGDFCSGTFCPISTCGRGAAALSISWANTKEKGTKKTTLKNIINHSPF